MPNIKEIALKIIDSKSRFRLGIDAMLAQDFAEAIVTELFKKADPVGTIVKTDNGYVNYRDIAWVDTIPDIGTKLYDLPPSTEQIEPVGLKELLEEVKKADEALSAGRNTEALVKIRTAWVCASIIKNSVQNKKVKTVEQIANETAEACAKYASSQMSESECPERAEYIAEAIRNGAWKEFVK